MPNKKKTHKKLKREYSSNKIRKSTSDKNIINNQVVGDKIDDNIKTPKYGIPLSLVVRELAKKWENDKEL
tara:strand:- start:164 stop:373 length:210 start_codon:yes stop_codon:yes gene_type:complete